MQDHILEYVRKHVVDSGQAALLTGPRASHELKELYHSLNEVEHRGIVEVNEGEVLFWTRFLGLLRGEVSRSDLERDRAVDLVETSLKELGHRYNLFLPDVDKMFHKYDIQKNGRMGASLRRIWSDRKTNLTIFGSASDENSENYKTTIGKYEYPFWVNNWVPINI